MSSVTVSLRLESDDLSLLESLVESSGVDRSAMMRSLLRRGMRECRLEQAAEAYRRADATLSRAAEIAGVSTWDFLARMGGEGLELHYGIEEFEADLDALASSR